MAIHFQQVGYTYLPKTPFQFEALKGITVDIPEHSFTAIIGHTGSGKSTLIQHLNGLLLPTTGRVQIGPYALVANEKAKHLKALRQYCGVVFQFPEYQLFEETVLKDIVFGPKNFGLKEEEELPLAKAMMKLVDLDESLLSRSPFELSGGQRRRVAIAGILAMKPDVLILDEPTAGLDPQGAKKMMSLFQQIHQSGTTIILVTHDMDAVLEYANHCIVMDHAKIVAEGRPSEIFANHQLLATTGLQLPKVFEVIYQLSAKGISIPAASITSLESLVDAIVDVRNNK